MKITMDITFNGRKYDSLEDATLAAALNGIQEIVSDKLKFLAPRIEKEGAIITVKAVGNTLEALKNTHVEVTDASDELIEDIRAALGN